MNKQLAVILCIVLLSLGFSAQAYVTQVQNGGFENGTNGWSAYNGWGSVCTLVNTPTHTGQKAAKIQGGNGNPWVSQWVAVVPGAEYRISAFLNVENLPGQSNAYGVFKLETYREYGNYATSTGDFGSAAKVYETGKWEELSETFIAPEGCNWLVIIVRFYGGGAMYVDDVNLESIGEIPWFTLSTDAVFYYTEEETGTARIEVPMSLKQDAANGTGVFSLWDANVLVIAPQSVKLTDGTASFTFAVNKLEHKGKAYTLRTELKDGEGNLLDRREKKIYRYDRPSCMDNNGNYIDENGSIFHPVISYHHPVANYREMKEANINVVQFYRPGMLTTKEALDLLYENGIKVLYPLYGGMHAAGSEENKASTKTIVSTYKDHPAIFGWMIMDEPFINGTTEDELEISYKLIRDIDTVHPTFIMENSSTQYERSAMYADILGIDPYPGTVDAIFDVEKNVRKAVEVLGGKKPVYTLVQTFQFNGWMPNFAETENMILQAFLAGSKGVGYYCFEDAQGQTELNYLDAWNALKKFSYKEAFALEGVPSTVDKGTYIQHSYASDTYVDTILMNKQNTVNQVTVSVPQGKISWINGTAPITVSGTDAVAKLPALGVIWFRQYTDGAKLGIYKENVEIKKLEQGTVEAHFSGQAERIVLALYQGEKLVDFSCSNTGGKVTLSVESEMRDCYLKAFAWDGIKSKCKAVMISA